MQAPTALLFYMRPWLASSPPSFLGLDTGHGLLFHGSLHARVTFPRHARSRSRQNRLCIHGHFAIPSSLSLAVSWQPFPLFFLLNHLRLLLSVLVHIAPQYSILRCLFPFYCVRALFLFLACFTLAPLLYLHFLLTLFSVSITYFLFILTTCVRLPRTGVYLPYNYLCSLYTKRRILPSLSPRSIKIHF
jgi:hypothetical protein